MIEIKLEDGQNGYNIVGEYIRRYWEHSVYDTVVVALGTSYEGKVYTLHKEVASPYHFDDIEYLYDWWEGEKYIRIYGIQAIETLDISGGIYTED